MIVVDTSAIMAILLGEPTAETCARAIGASDRVIISAGTVAELLVVATCRHVRHRADDFLTSVPMEIRPVTSAEAQRIGSAYARWGKGLHPASLNYGDCFAYALAKSENCPLLYIGNDFTKTDIVSALA